METRAITPEGGGFEAAQKAAVHEAEKDGGDPMLIAWHDNESGRSSPEVEACGCTTLAGWEVYAGSRGADLRVEVDGGKYVFIFLHI